MEVYLLIGVFCFVLISPRLRRQFCRERLPPERDGGMREVQRDGSQAEEHAGSSQAFFFLRVIFLLISSP